LGVEPEDVVVHVDHCEGHLDAVDPERLELQAAHRARGVLDQHLVHPEDEILPRLEPPPREARAEQLRGEGEGAHRWSGAQAIS
jgi:hypothetical protein